MDGLSYTGSWLELQATPILYHRFSVEGDIANYTFKLGDTELTPIWMGDNTYAIAVSEIYIQDLAFNYAVSVSDGESSCTLTYNALNYMKLAYADATLKDLIASLFLYYTEANAYIN